MLSPRNQEKDIYVNVYVYVNEYINVCIIQCMYICTYIVYMYIWPIYIWDRLGPSLALARSHITA